MSIFEIPNIEHCDLVPVGTIAYRVIAHDGWYIHKANDPDGVDENGNPTKLYRTYVIIALTEDMSGIEIISEPDLPSNAEICGDTNNDHEVM